MKSLVFEVNRDYSIADVIENSDPLTVRELKVMIEDLDDDMYIICSHDDGYAYGSLSRDADIRKSVAGKYRTEFDTIDFVYI